MTTQRLYLSFHPLYLTSPPLYQWHHTCCTSDITTGMEVITLGIRMTSYTLYMKSHWQFMISILSIYDITTTLFDIISTLSLSSHPLYWWYHISWIYEISSDIYIYIWGYHTHCIQQHIHYICNITATVSVSHTHFFHYITPFVCMTLHPLYV